MQQIETNLKQNVPFQWRTNFFFVVPLYQCLYLPSNKLTPWVVIIYSMDLKEFVFALFSTVCVCVILYACIPAFILVFHCERKIMSTFLTVLFDGVGASLVPMFTNTFSGKTLWSTKKKRNSLSTYFGICRIRHSVKEKNLFVLPSFSLSPSHT